MAMASESLHCVAGSNLSDLTEMEESHTRRLRFEL